MKRMLVEGDNGMNVRRRSKVVGITRSMEEKARLVVKD